MTQRADALRVRVLVPVRNEQARLGAMLESVLAGLAHASKLGAVWDSELVVVLDACTDRSRAVAEAYGAVVLDCPSPGGKVEALRAGIDPRADIHVCIDGDVRLGARTLFDLVEALRIEPSLLASCPPLAPEPLTGWVTPLGWALHRYNAARGFSSERLWLSGRCYAVRKLRFPAPAELQQRAGRVPVAARVAGLAAPLGADDVWLSRALLRHGQGAIRHLDTDPVRYRAPSSYRGMSRTYRRLRRELTRIDLLFPELPGPGRDRRVDSVDGVRDRLALLLFQLGLSVCKAHARVEQQLHSLLGRAPDPWPVVTESKR